MLAKGFPTTTEKSRLFGDLLSNEIKPRFKYAMVFDDLHLIDDQAVLGFIARVAENSAINNSVVFISRVNNLVNQNKLVEGQRLSYITEADLSFTKNEMTDLFLFYRITVVPEQITNIYNETEGWAFAVGLAAKLMKSHLEDANYVIGALKHNVTQMIDENVFTVISPEARSFLVRLSLIDYLSVDLISQTKDGQALMDELLQATSLIRYDSFLCVYRVHHLLFDYLRGKQDLLTQQEITNTYILAARWCRDNGHKMDAFNYYDKIKDYQTILELAFSLPLVIPFDTAQFLLEILKRAPEQVFVSNPTARVIHTRLLLSLGKLDEATIQINDYIAQLKQCPETPDNCRTLLGLYNNLGFAGMVGCIDTANYQFWQYFKEAERYQKPSGFIPMGPVTVANLGPFACRVGKPNKGEPEKYIEAMGQAVLYTSQTMNGCLYGFDDLINAEVAFYRLDVNRAEHFALQALYKSRTRGQFEVESRTLFLLLRAYLSVGKFDKTMDVLSQLEQQVENQNFINRHSLYEIETGWFYALMGEHSRVASWLKSKNWLTGVGALLDGFSDLAVCKFYLMDKDYGALLAFLDCRISANGISKFLLGQIGLMVNSAVCHYHLGNRAEAIDCLQKAYWLAKPNQFIMPFAEMGNSMRSLAGSILKTKDSSIPTEWLETIRRKSATYAKRVAHVRARFYEAQHLGYTVQLTNKEMQLLEDLAQGLSRTEISLARNISVNTVKVMLQTIYEKLGAENGIEAVRIAASRQLL
jgi:LuxR family maltose regulon positive regulatory protein